MSRITNFLSLTIISLVHTIQEIIGWVSTCWTQGTGTWSRRISFFSNTSSTTSSSRTITARAGEIEARTETKGLIKQTGLTSWTQTCGKIVSTKLFQINFVLLFKTFKGVVKFQSMKQQGRFVFINLAWPEKIRKILNSFYWLFRKFVHMRWCY